MRLLTGVKLKSGQTLNGHNSIIFKYYEKEKYRFESKFNLVFILKSEDDFHRTVETCCLINDQKNKYLIFRLSKKNYTKEI